MGSGQVAPGTARIWLELGKLRMDLDEPGAAVPALRRAVHMVPHDEQAAYCLAEAAVAAGQKPVALAAMDHWVRLRNHMDVPPVPLEGAPPAHDIEAQLQV